MGPGPETNINISITFVRNVEWSRN